DKNDEIREVKNGGKARQRKNESGRKEEKQERERERERASERKGERERDRERERKHKLHACLCVCLPVCMPACVSACLCVYWAYSLLQHCRPQMEPLIAMNPDECSSSPANMQLTCTNPSLLL